MEAKADAYAEAGPGAAPTRLPPSDESRRIVGLRGLSLREIDLEVQSGARFVVFTYCVSALVVSTRQRSHVYFLRPGDEIPRERFTCSLISFFLGWWGIPFGLIWTPLSIIENMRGGRDITQEVMAGLAQHAANEGHVDQLPEDVRKCPRCSTIWRVSDYRPDALDIRCDSCGAPLER
ncbi:hypothetical protein L6R52_39945 [Myxococcota bacterium]|nr:hypothetical protein [Myxococcota bacterium]